MAKPTPMLPEEVPSTEALAVVMATTRPAASTSGPPELPGVDGGVGLDGVVDRPARLPSPTVDPGPSPSLGATRMVPECSAAGSGRPGGLDLQVDQDAGVIAEPDPVDRAVADQPGGQDPRPGPRVGVPGADEHVVDPPPVAGLPDQPVDLGGGDRVVHRPGVAGPVAGHRPGVVVVDAAPLQGLQAAQVPDARSVRAGVEVAGDDRRQRRPVPRVQLADLDGLETLEG